MMAVGMTARTEVPELRRAILLTYYGTSDDSARAVSTDVLTQRVREAFPDVEVRESYTSRAAANAMRRRTGKPHPSVEQGMKQLEADGYNSVIVVSGELIEGSASRLQEHRIDTLRHHFFEVKTVKPLLTTSDDCRRVMTALAGQLDLQPDEHVVFVTDGRNGRAEAVLSLCDYILQHEGYDHCHMATAEGYPSMENVKQRLRQSHAQRVVLVPLKLVASHHNQRLLNTWGEALEAEGYRVRSVPGAMLEYRAVQDIIVDKIREADRQP